MLCVSNRGVQILVCFLHTAPVLFEFLRLLRQQSCSMASELRTNRVFFLPLSSFIPLLFSVVVVECVGLCVFDSLNPHSNKPFFVCVRVSSQIFTQVDNLIFFFFQRQFTHTHKKSCISLTLLCLP